MRNVTCRSHLAGLEPLEQRTLMSGTPSILYDAHSIVRGRTVAEWEAASWQKVFGTPVYASDGTTIINPMFP